MSRRRTARSRQVVSSEEEDAGPPPPRAARRAALQLSQSQHASGGASSAGNALAMLLAGAKPPAAPSGGTGGTCGPSQAREAAAGAAAGGSSAASRRRGRATLPRPKQPVPAALAAAAAADARGSQQQGAALPAAAADLWVEKHAPRSEAELVVHKKKVQEVREWLEQQRASLGQRGASRLLVVSGPSGCGKTATLTTLATAVGFDVSEWRPPPAVQWEEAQYAGIQRRNKVEEFEEFVVRTKMPHLSLRSSSSSSAATGAGPPGASGGSPSAGPRSSQLPRPSQAAAVEAAAAAAAAGRGGSSSQGGTQALRPGRLAPSLLPTLVIVDDLPHAAGPEQRRQIAQALGDMAAGARFPVVVVATETSGKAQQEKGLSAAAGTYQGLHKELVAVLEAHRATTISFNPFTPLGIAKALKAVLDRERLALPDAEVAAIAEGANGDLHNAIATLQFVCTGAAPAALPAKARGKAAAARGTKRKAAGSKAAGTAAAAGGEDGGARVAFALRDSSLSLFHALGKLLYNKRLPAVGGGSQAQAAASQQQQSQQQQRGGQEGEGQPSSAKRQWTANGFWLPGGSQAAPAGLPLAAWAQRAPMEFDPEAVLAGAGLEAGSVTAFLHENILNFIEEGAVEDAAGCMEALSAADCMAAGRRWGSSEGELFDDDSPSSTLLDAAAASTAARGVCFANAHPAPRRWLPLKAPAVFTVGRGRAANLAELARSTAPAWAVHGGMRSLEPAGRLAAELLPYARTLSTRGGYPWLVRLQPMRWSRFWNGQLYEQQGGGQAAGGGGSGGSWEEQEQADALAAAAAAGTEQAAEADAIEESEDDDDCTAAPMAALLAELPGMWQMSLDSPAGAREASDLSRAPSLALSLSDGAGNSAASQAGSLSDFAQLAYSPGPSSISRSSLSSLGSMAGTLQRSSEDSDSTAPLVLPPGTSEGDVTVKLTASGAGAAADLKPPSGPAAASSFGGSAPTACGSGSTARHFSLFSSASASLEPLPLRAASPSLPLAPANSMGTGSPSGSGSGSAGPPPAVLLAALSASLMAKQAQEQLAASLAAGAGGGGAGSTGAVATAAARVVPAQPACACPSCHMVFADIAAYRAHCASQEHSVNIVHASLAMSMPRIALATTGIPQLAFRQGAATTAATAPTQPLPAVPMPVRGSTAAARTLVRSPSAPSGLAPGFSHRGAADLFSELRVSDTVSGSVQRAPGMPSAPDMLLPSVASLPSMALPAATCHVAPSPMAPHVVDRQLDALAHALLKQLRQLDGMERAGAVATAAGLAPLNGAPECTLAAAGFTTLPPTLPPVPATLPLVPNAAADPALAALPDSLLGGGKPLRRLVGGLREVRKAVKSGSAVAVVAAVDIQENNPFDRSAKPAADIAEICELARARGVAVVFALNRIGLGSVFGTNKRMSAVALTNVSGLEGPTRRMLQMAEVCRAQWAARLRTHTVLART